MAERFPSLPPSPPAGGAICACGRNSQDDPVPREPDASGPLVVAGPTTGSRSRGGGEMALKMDRGGEMALTMDRETADRIRAEPKRFMEDYYRTFAANRGDLALTMD
ncbi:hypothetical protein NL676_019986 [Syzygium grande]|nr:hypothetical protein NL676_019986 [Syzygium grande]